MKHTTCIAAALMTAAGLAFAVPASAQTAAGTAPTARTALFDFARLDADGDGKVTAAEIAAARAADTASLDADGDGKISAAELVAWQTARVEARVMAEIAALDTDGDGALSAAELVGRRAGRAAQAMPQALFDRVDTDKDGAISQAEYDAAKAKLQGRAQSARNGNRRGSAVQGNTHTRHDRMLGNNGGQPHGRVTGNRRNTGAQGNTHARPNARLPGKSRRGDGARGNVWQHFRHR